MEKIPNKKIIPERLREPTQDQLGTNKLENIAA
jgi:hypothetical protein